MSSTEHLRGLLPEQVALTMALVELAVTTLKNDDDFESCHQVALAVQGEIGEKLEYHRGYFGEHHQHSWLTISGFPQYIIDPYPVACIGGPLLVDRATNLIIPTPWNDLSSTEW